MASGDSRNAGVENLAQAQRDTVQALSTLTAPLRGETAPGGSAATVAQTGGPAPAAASTPATTDAAGTSLQTALADATSAVQQLAQNVAADTAALQNVDQGLSGLPALLAGLAGGAGGGGGLLSGILGGGLGLVSLGASIARLFTGGPGTPAPLPVYAPPPSLSVDVANAPGFPVAVQDQSGGVRAAPASQAQNMQVTVNVSAMDSQSILDRSDDIAQAVRQAMLHMHPLNDLINEL